MDADGVTEEFTSEWQAEAYRLELQGQAEQTLLERAKGLISDFCRSEYGSEADFSDIAKIGVAYTTITDDEIPVQVNIDLVNFRLERYLDDEHLETRQYGSLQELISNELENLDFSDLIHVSDEDVDQYLWREPEEAVAEAPETAPAPQREPFPYSVGDTVYLENSKPYVGEKQPQPFALFTHRGFPRQDIKNNHVAGFVHKALQRKDAVPADKIISVHIRHLAL